jgi:hypothetical protein
MIISNKHRFIFAAIPKTGTHSVRRALRRHMGPEDHEQVRLYAESALPFGQLADIGHGHLTLEQLKPHLDKSVFDSYFKFAFVRNPFDRFISFCAFMTRQQGQFEVDPQGVMRHFIDHPPVEKVLFGTQHHFITDPAGKLMTDAVGRVEQMQESYDILCKKIGIPSEKLEKANSSRRGDYRQYYTSPDLVEGVAKFYQADLDLFHYQF